MPIKNAIVMAAGKGTRMHSELPKVLHQVAGMPMAELIVKNLKKAGAERTITIVGYGHEQVEAALRGQCEFALQEPQLGTGHAVMQAQALAESDGWTIVSNGDVPGLRAETYAKLYDSLQDADMAVLVVRLDDPSAYGRVVTNRDGDVEKIVEFKDCTEAEKAIHEINTGIYAFDNRKLFDSLKCLKNNNAQKEYYITDLVEIFRNQGYKVVSVEAEDAEEVQGVNDCVELSDAEARMMKRINEGWMKKGVTIVDPKNTYIGPEVTIGKDVLIYPNVTIYGTSVIEDNVTLMPNCYLNNATIGKGAVIRSSEVVNQAVTAGAVVGPFAHLNS